MSQAYSTITACIWGLSVMLQLTLLIALFHRRNAAKFPLFLTFIGFCLARSVLLYVTFGYISTEQYSSLYNLMLLLDMLVQFGLAAELTQAIVRERGGWAASRMRLVLCGALFAALGTWFAVWMIPRASVPLDRSQMFFSIVGVLLFVASFRSSNYFSRTVAQGWGMYCIISLAAGVGRVLAADGDHPLQYATWSYVLAGAYLAVVIFWLVTLRAPSQRPTPVPLKASD